MTIDRYTSQLADEQGWATRSSAEDRIAVMLHSEGFRPGSGVETQFKIGLYRIDFAFPAARVALEVDGWLHRHPDHVAADKKRDRKLRDWGWDTFRINAEAPEEEIRVQIGRIVEWVRRGTPTGYILPGLNPLLTVDKVAELLSIGRVHVYKLLKDGAFSSIKLGRCRRILRADVEAFLRAQSIGASEPDDG